MNGAFVFPGQGSQAVGMGADIAAAYPEARAVFDRASEALGFDIAGICFEGPESVLNTTEYTQPAVLTASVAVLSVLSARGIVPIAVAGHSLGEYSALVAAQVMRLEDAVKLVHLRGKAMSKAVPPGEGSMAAVMGLADADVERICSEASRETGLTVMAANFNSPGQVVISGAAFAVARACELAAAAGAKRCVSLAVSGPFHSPLMEPAARELADALSRIELLPPKVQFWSNVTAGPVEDPEEIRTRLVQQVLSPVRWTAQVERMVACGITDFLEVGPGKVLSGLIKRISRDARARSAGTQESLEEIIAASEA